MKKDLTIIYVASKYDYGFKERGFSFEHENFYKTLKHMFTKIIYFDFATIYKEKGKDFMNSKLLEIVKSKKPDFLFCCLTNDEFYEETFSYISRKTNTTTFNWFCDDHWRFENYSKNWANCFNYVSTTDRDSYIKYKELGFNNVILTQWGCNIYDYKNFNLKKIFDVIFIGQPHGDRLKIIKFLKKSKVNVKCWGYGWDNKTNNFLFKAFWFFPKQFPILKEKHSEIIKRNNLRSRVSQNEMIKLYNQSKIGLNLSNSSINSVQQIKGRNFEIPGTGCFLLTNYVKYLEEYYEIGKEIICFYNLEELVDEIKYYLKHESEREKIAECGYIKTINKHTYEIRFNEIFKKIGLFS